MGNLDLKDLHMPRKTAHELYLSRNTRNLEQRLKYKASVMKAHAAERGIGWHLTTDDIVTMWRQQNGRCAYTGKRMFLTIGRGFGFRKCAVSIDRLDPSGSYTLDNTVLCRFDTNNRKGKRNLFSTDFVETFPDFVANILTLKPDFNLLTA